MSEQYSLADLFGDDELLYKPVEKKKAEPKKAEVKEKKGASKKVAVAPLPITVISDAFQVNELTAADFGLEPEATDVLLDEFKKHLASVHKQWAAGLINIDFVEKDGHKAYIYPANNYSRELTKNSKIVDSDGYVITFSGFTIPIEGLEGELTLEKVQELWETQYPIFKGCRYFYDGEAKVIVPSLKNETFDIRLPFKVNLFGGEEYVLTEDLFDKMLDDEDDSKNADSEEDENTDSDEDDSEDDENEGDEDTEPEDAEERKDAKTGKCIKIKLFLDRLSRKYNGISFGATRIYRGEKKDEVTVMVYATKEYATFAAPPKKEQTFPSNAVLSLYFKKFDLTAEDFGGKKKITTKDVINYLHAKGFVEYTESATIIAYVKERNMIKVSPGEHGKKGVDFFTISVR